MKPARLVETSARKSSAVYSVNGLTRKMPAFATTASIEPNFLIASIRNFLRGFELTYVAVDQGEMIGSVKALSISSRSARFLPHHSRGRETPGRLRRQCLATLR